ncbi:DUF998 domain-containing protein [Nocardiopsis sp. RSe5-2]|uniref:DUF998 domain-containing protein n=1 Tax=Nocardiopsis endophytica TaxID=3018445 RepID=A0ABT4U312_9ACTN|nr:DUF998 domain-containing protein [Nocardiopsis endophytica]MDA2811346.1 DUF998 domain-containing protein [Nocardiopsis endophytica]
MAESAPGPDGGFDRGAAVTRSLLGWGVVAGAFYLAVGITLGLTSTGFDFGRHALSLLMIGESGWVQTANLILSGLMVLAAAAGVWRATAHGPRRAPAVSLLVGVYGLSLIGSGLFPPDPAAGYPQGAAEGTVSASGLLHLAFGGVGFLSLAVAAFLAAAWFARRGASGLRLLSLGCGTVVALGFIGGAALSTGTAGVVSLWAAVVAGWVWLAAVSAALYRTVPHPDRDRRPA